MAERFSIIFKLNIELTDENSKAFVMFKIDLLIVLVPKRYKPIRN